MPLPANGTPWPPKALTGIADRLAEWSAWYEGTPEGLREVYQRGTTARFAVDINRPAQYRGGVAGAIARFWWGRPIETTGEAQRVDQLHVPIAADLCQASADLLYAEPPTFTVADTGTQERLERLVDDGLHTVLATGAELGAALGGRYHRVTWDRTVHPDRPFLTTVDADAALPEFRWDQLIAVTFWHVLERETGGKVVRHLERHELDTAGNGLVLHGLYEGTANDLGRALPLTEHPVTAPLATAIGADGAITEGRTPGLLVEYVPNQRPQRRWRHHPIGRSLGRSDLDGVEGPMDALDEAYSSWMRDLRLAKSRIFIPDYMLQAGKPGQGASFDLDREVYVPVKSAAPEDGDATITLNQFTIRVEEHQRTCQELTEVILRSAGYSAQTFGEATDGASMTATEVSARERRSYLTRDRKIRLERPAVARLVEKLLSVDAAVFGTKVVAERPAVTFGDAVQESPLLLAQTVQAMDVARAASIETKVRTLHPDWTDEQVITEVEALKGEQGAPVRDPFAIST